MSRKNQKTGKKQEKVGKGHPPKEYQFKPGNPGGGRPKGKRNFKTDFELAAREIAKALRLGESPDPIYIELMKQGIKQGLKGNYNFWKDIAERVYGKEVSKFEADVKKDLKLDDEQFNELKKLIK